MSDEDVFDDEQSERPSVKLDIPLIILRQVDRVNIAFSKGDPQVLTAVLALESTLIGYAKVDAYKNVVEKAEQEYREAVVKAELENAPWEKDRLKASAAMILAQLKYRELMRIVYGKIVGSSAGGAIGKKVEAVGEVVEE